MNNLCNIAYVGISTTTVKWYIVNRTMNVSKALTDKRLHIWKVRQNGPETAPTPSGALFCNAGCLCDSGLGFETNGTFHRKFRKSLFKNNAHHLLRRRQPTNAELVAAARQLTIVRLTPWQRNSFNLTDWFDYWKKYSVFFTFLINQLNKDSLPNRNDEWWSRFSWKSRW